MKKNEPPQDPLPEYRKTKPYKQKREGGEMRNRGYITEHQENTKVLCVCVCGGG